MGVEEFLEEWCHSANRIAVRWEWWWVFCWGGGFCGIITLTRLVHMALFSIVIDLDVPLNDQILIWQINLIYRSNYLVFF
jgi:hypothetical protein